MQRPNRMLTRINLVLICVCGGTAIILGPETSSNVAIGNQDLVSEMTQMRMEMVQMKADIVHMNDLWKSAMADIQSLEQENVQLKSKVIMLELNSQTLQDRVYHLDKNNSLQLWSLETNVQHLKEGLSGQQFNITNLERMAVNIEGDMGVLKQNMSSGCTGDKEDIAAVQRGVVQLQQDVSDLNVTQKSIETSVSTFDGIKQQVDGIGSVVFFLQYKGDSTDGIWMTSYTPDTIMKFDDVIINVGGGYNTTNGIFTCPRAGLYLLAIRCSVDWRVSGRSSIYTYLHKNGVVLVKASADEDENAENDYVQIPAYLEEGDQLSVEQNFRNSKEFPAKAWTFFSGVLLVPKV